MARLKRARIERRGTDMSSILTNNSAMVALETLRGINKNLSMVQNEISTGKKVANAKDNAAIWAISTVMSTDVESFKQITDSLNLGSSTVGVARSASESVTGLLQDMKELIVSAQEDNVDRTKIQNDVEKIRTTIGNIVDAAQFNGQNLVKGTDDVNILASLNRDSSGNVTATDLTVSRQDLTTTSGVYGSGDSLAGNITASAGTIDSTGAANQVELTFAQVGGATDALTVTVNGSEVSTAWDTDAATTVGNMVAAINQLGLTGITADNTGAQLEILNTNSFDSFDVSWDTNGNNTIAVVNNFDTDENAGAAAGAGSATLGYRAEEVALSTSATVNEGDSYRITVNGNNYNYIAGKNETMEDVARGLKTAIDGGEETGVTTSVVQEDSQWKVLVDYDGTDTDAGATMTLTDNGQAGGTASGGLFGLDNIDVSTSTGAEAALGNVETLISNSIDAAAAFGSSQKQIETQGEFVQTLIDSLTSGIGAMVDADMEAASAKLQALQVQQQLGVQALSIANSSPQTLLGLFR
ncbi:MAG: hypothetical protein MRY64_00665 [Hyphomonadaceae bacterium]|nr:hypothetical protein [Hyphomonadaceae bacterium]